MSTTLSYGFVKPQDGDTGAVFFPALEGNIQKINDHTHNGSNSSRIASSAVAATTDTISSGSWSSSGAGYIQTITMPSGMSVDEYGMVFQDDATGNRIYPSVSKASSSTYTVKVNDNTLDLTVLYV